MRTSPLKWIAAAALIGLAATPVAAEPDPAEALWTSMGQVTTLQADFVQVRHSQLLSQPLTSSGTLRFERPGKLAWTVESPARSTFVMDGTTVGMLYPDLGVREEIDLASSPEATQLVQGMMVWLNGDLAAVRADYDLTWSAGPPVQATLVPKGAPLSGVLSRIELVVQGEPPVIQHVTLHEPDGDRVEITLSNVQTGVTFPADAFLLP
jgi:outer membrane lipoprotein-sorting protein